MNKIFNINLGGYPFTIDENAYHKLNLYLDKIENHFSASEGCDEIIFDIESRMAELFNESLKGQPIVSQKDVNSAVAIMGTPEDFGASAFDEDEPINTRQQSKEYTTGKKLFRDPENKKIGGVCSGLAAYFGVEDPLWIRLGTVLFFFIGGLALPAYILLWIVVPKARTAGDKLAMRGERIDINNIAKTIEDEFDNLSDTFSELDKKLRSKKKSKIRSGGTAIKSLLSSAIGLIVLVAVTGIRIFKKVLRPVISLALICIGLFFSISWVAAIIGTMVVSPFVGFFSAGSSFMGYTGMVSGLFSLGIPIFGVIFLITKFYGKYKIRPHIKSRIWGVWAASFLIFIASVVQFSMQWQKGSEISTQTELLGIQEGTLILKMDHEKYDDESLVSLDNVSIDNNKLRCNDVRVIINEIEGETLTVDKIVSSRGSKKSEAFKHISQVNVDELKIKDNKIVIPSYFTINRGSKYRGQTLVYKFNIPKSYNVKKDYAIHR